jgi:hypothetical protein
LVTCKGITTRIESPGALIDAGTARSSWKVAPGIGVPPVETLAGAVTSKLRWVICAPAALSAKMKPNWSVGTLEAT